MKTLSKRFSLVLAAAVLAAPMAVQASNQTPGSTASPQATEQLEKKVRHELVMLPWFSVFDNLTYRVDGGTVTLLGEVTRPTLRSSAENVVKRIEGVSKVNNQIEVLPLSPFDDSVRLRTARAIYGFPSLQRYGLGTQPSIRIIVKNGNVSLEGVVNSHGDRNLAGIRANGVFGAFSVTNNLRVVRG
ncbi:MAG: BON domain-containing protein [Acidobacteria bacterium]|nr:BON domain-containing protein [Acidobacteriota bacterium]